MAASPGIAVINGIINGHLVEPCRSFGELKNVTATGYFRHCLMIPKIVSYIHAQLVA